MTPKEKLNRIKAFLSSKGVRAVFKITYFGMFLEIDVIENHEVLLKYLPMNLINESDQIHRCRYGILLDAAYQKLSGECDSVVEVKEEVEISIEDQIRFDYATGYTQRELTVEYGFSIHNIRRILQNLPPTFPVLKEAKVKVVKVKVLKVREAKIKVVKPPKPPKPAKIKKVKPVKPPKKLVNRDLILQQYLNWMPVKDIAAHQNVTIQCVYKVLHREEKSGRLNPSPTIPDGMAVIEGYDNRYWINLDGEIFDAEKNRMVKIDEKKHKRVYLVCPDNLKRKIHINKLIKLTFNQS